MRFVAFSSIVTAASARRSTEADSSIRKGIPQFGLVSEEVANVSPDLVARDEQGKPYSVRNEAGERDIAQRILKEHKAFLEEDRTVQDLKAAVAQQQKQIEMLTAGLQKVSAQLELSKSARQTVLNNQSSCDSFESSPPKPP